MDRFAEIVNSGAVRSNTTLSIPGFYVNQSGWNRFSFYPNNGVVRVIIGEAQCCEGVIYLLQCDNEILVPVLPRGIREISSAEFRRRLPNNKTVGRASSNQMNSKFNVDEMMDEINRMLGF